MHKIIVLIPLLILTACKDMGGPGVINPREFLDSLEGPKVPTVRDTLLDSAKNAEKSGDFRGAGQMYQQVLEKDPDNMEALTGFAESYRRTGDFDRAITLYDSVLLKDPASLAAKEGKGLALMSKGDFDTPGALFEDVLNADQTRWKTLNALGILFITRDLQNEAQQYFNAALKQSPNNPSILNNLGLSQALSRKYDDASATLMQASAFTAPGSIERKRVDLNLALVYATSGKLEAANAIASQYFTGAVLNNNMGLYAHLAKDDQLAKAYLNMALTDSKTFYEKAWDNLQTLNGAGAISPSATSTAPLVITSEQKKAEDAKREEAAKNAEKEKPKPKAKTKTKAKKAKVKPKAVPAAEATPPVEPPPAPVPAVAPEAPAAAKSADDISAIVNRPAQEDPVPESPIP